MTDYRSPALQVPARKPLPSSNAGLHFHSSNTSNTVSPGPHNQRPQTSSSSSLLANQSITPLSPMKPKATAPPHSSHGHAHPQAAQHYDSSILTRNASIATSSTNSTGGNGTPGRQLSNAGASDIRRNSSSRSTISQSGYVTSMRKQRATVWCERAQMEDPRVQAQRLAAKRRAMQEMQGAGSGRSSTLTSSGKIRQNAGGRTMNYGTGTMVGAAVPMRLSANEVGDAEEEVSRGQHPPRGPATATGGGVGAGAGATGTAGGAGGAGGARNSAGSSRFPSGYQRPSQARFSSASSTHTPPNDERPDIPEIVETPVEVNGDDDDDDDDGGGGDTSPVEQTTYATGRLQLHDPDSNHPSITSSSVSEREESFGHVPEMTTPSGATAAAAQQRKATGTDDLKRRGSVDDRSSNMSGVKLFVANPDLSD